MPFTGLTVDLSQTLAVANKLDNAFKRISESSAIIKQNMHEALSGGAPKFNNEYLTQLDALKELTSQIKDSFSNIDTSNMDRIVEGISGISEIVDGFSKSGGDVKIFDTKAIYTTEDSVSDIFNKINELRDKTSDTISELRTKADSLLPELVSLGSEIAAREEKIKSLKGSAYDKSRAKTDKMREEFSAKTAEYEGYKRDIKLAQDKAKELEAIYQEELKYANMTVDQRRAYLQKSLDRMSREEESNSKRIRSMYKLLQTEIQKVRSAESSYESIGVNSLSPKSKSDYAALISYEKELYSSIETLETAHLETISDLKKRYAVRDVSEQVRAERERIKNEQEAWNAYLRTPEGAEAMSDSAKSIREQKEAMELLKAAKEGLSSETEGYRDILERLDSKIQKHRINIEELTKAEKNEETLQPTVRNEYKRLLVELDKLKNKREELMATSAYKGDPNSSLIDQITTQYDVSAIEKREQDVMSKIANIRKNSYGLLDEVEREHDAKLAQEHADRVIRADQELNKKRQEEQGKYGLVSASDALKVVSDSYNSNNVRQYERAIQKLKETRDKLDKSDSAYTDTVNDLNNAIKHHEEEILRLTDAEKYAEQQRKRSLETYSGAMSYAKSASSIHEMKEALSALKNVRDKIDITKDKDKYDDVSSAIEELTNKYNSLTGEMSKSDSAADKLSRSLLNKFAAVFSVSQITGYINKLIEVRGEFELQQRSLQALIQDYDKANEVFAKTVQLAVKSPFKIKELVTYTKQLAAYRIESDKLYDTNKMLADISAGLGVEMDRLILAYGQVRSASFLRGTELRQFTEAGIPMLEALSNRFSLLEGRAVSVGDVFERISKRMVMFSDVDAVLRSMTEAGGQFYNMQEIQAQTMKGMISNLRDSLDIMMNDIGKENEFAMKLSINLMKTITDNWRVVSRILSVIISGLALYKINLIAAGKATNVLSVALKSASNTMVGFFKGAIKNPKTLAIMVALYTILSVVNSIVKRVVELNKITKNFLNMRNNIASISTELKNALDNNDIDEAKDKLASIVEIANKEYNMDVKINIKDATESELKQIAEKLTEQMYDINIFAENFVKEGSKMKTNFLGDKYDNSYSKLASSSKVIAYYLREAEKSGLAFNEAEQEALRFLSAGKDAQMGETEYAEKLNDAYSVIIKKLGIINTELTNGVGNSDSISNYANLITEAFSKAGTTVGKISRYIEGMSKKSDRAERRFKKLISDIDVSYMSDEDKVIYLKTAVDKLASEKEWIGFKKEDIYRWTEEVFYIKFAPSPIDPNTLTNWQKSYNKLFSGNAGFAEITDNQKTRDDVISYLEGFYKEYKDIIEKISNAGTGEGSAYEGYDLEEYKDKLEQVKKQLAWFGVDPDATKASNSQTDWISKMISLVKDMNKSYEDLNKTFDKTTSEMNTMTSFEDAFKETFGKTGLKIGDLDFTTPEGVAAFLEKLLPYVKTLGSKYVQELQKAIADYKVEIGVEVKKKNDEELIQSIQDMFDRYELSVELKNLDIPEDLGEELFNIDYLDLNELKKVIEDMKHIFIGTEMEDEYKKFIEKVNDMEKKASIERMKTYVQYLKEGMNERVKLKVEELKKLKELEETSGLTDSQKDKIYEQIRSEYIKEQQKQDWEDFKNSELYTMIFDDLEYYGTATIEKLKNKLVELKSGLSALDPSDMKEIVRQINNIEDTIISRNPFKSLRDIIKEMKGIKSENEYQIQLFDANAEIERLSRIIDAYSVVTNPTTDYTIDEDTMAHYSALLAISKLEGKTAEEIIDEYKDIIKQQKKSANEAENGIRKHKMLGKAIEAIGESWDEMSGYINAIIDSSIEGMEALGVDIGYATEPLAEGVKNMNSLISSAIAFAIQMKEVGYASNAALGIIGWIAMSIQAIVSVIKTITSIKDAKIKAQLESIRKSVEHLSEEYEKLSEKMDVVYDSRKAREYNKELQENIDLRKKNLKMAIASISDKHKKKYKEQLEELTTQLNELEETEEEAAIKYSQMWGGFGDDDSRRSFIEDLTKSWMESFKETGDGLKGLEEQWDEYFENLVYNQLVMRSQKKAVDSYMDMWDKYVSANSEEGEDLTPTEIDALKKYKNYLLEGMNEDLQRLAEIMGYSGVEEGSLSELQKGIQGITENQAEVIESYLNSIRMFVAQNNNELKEHTKYLKNLYELFNGMTASYSSGGIGLKVVM